MLVLASQSELRFNACFDTLWSIGDRLVLWTGHVAPRPALPQALYLVDCNQITRVFTWVIDPYLMPCLTRVDRPITNILLFLQHISVYSNLHARLFTQATVLPVSPHLPPPSLHYVRLISLLWRELHPWEVVLGYVQCNLTIVIIHILEPVGVEERGGQFTRRLMA